jgi:alpha-beta hydrolase superfamily lysophospholipase
MITEYFTLSSPVDGLLLDGLFVLPETPPKAVVQLVHGMCEHKMRYLPFMEHLAQQGYACCMHDHRGHGKSVRAPEDLGYFYAGGGPAVVEDLHAVNQMLHEKFPGLPVYLFGHSMGSLAVRAYIKKYDDTIEALVVCGSPSKPTGVGVGKALVRLLQAFKGEKARSKLVDGILNGSFDKPFRHENRKSAWLSSDPAVGEAFNADPLCGYTFTLNGYLALLYLVEETYSEKGWQVQQKDLPVLFVSGSDDPCAVSAKKFVQSVWHMERMGYKNVFRRVYSGMRHEILNEVDKETVYRELSAFFDDCLRGPDQY